jgi:WD40 repeat protein
VSRLSESGFEGIAWAPDGGAILAIGVPAAPSTQANVFEIDVPSGDVQLITLAPGQFSNPSWSPDGTRAAITVDLDTVWLLDLAGGGLSPLSTGEASVWSADGKVLFVYAGNLSQSDADQRVLRVMDAEGSERGILSIGDLSTDEDRVEHVSALSLSEDGTRLAYSITVPQRGNNLRESFIAELVTGAVTPFRPDERTGFLSWAPDSEAVAYIRFGVDDYVGELVIADADGECVFKPSLPGEISSISWGPDGGSIAFVYYGSVYVLDVTSVELESPPGGGC